MNNPLPRLALASTLGLAALGAVVVGPAVAVAATSETTATAAVGDRVSRISQALSGLVSDGSISQAQADEVATTLAEALPHRGHGGRGHHGGPGGGLRGLEEAATVLDATVEELRTALEGGSSLADVAAEKGVPTQELVDALVAAAEAHLAEKVTEGRLTQEQADARAAELPERIAALVEREGLPPRHGRGGPPPADAPAEQVPDEGAGSGS